MIQGLFSRFVATSVLVLFVAAAVQAGPTNIVNGDFSSSISTGWTVTTNGGGADVWTFTGSEYSPAHAGPVCYAYGSTNNSTDTVISQVLSELYAPNRVYTLTTEVGRRADMTFNLYDIELWAGSSKLASANSPTPDAGKWALATATFDPRVTPGSFSGSLQVKLVAHAPGSARQISFDNVALSWTAIPEPACLSLLGIAVLALARRRHL